MKIILQESLGNNQLLHIASFLKTQSQRSTKHNIYIYIFFFFFHIYSKLNHSIGSFVNVDETIQPPPWDFANCRRARETGRATVLAVARNEDSASWADIPETPTKQKKAHSEKELVGGWTTHPKNTSQMQDLFSIDSIITWFWWNIQQFGCWKNTPKTQGSNYGLSVQILRTKKIIGHVSR